MQHPWCSNLWKKLLPNHWWLNHMSLWPAKWASKTRRAIPSGKTGSHHSTYRFQTKEQLPLQPANRDYTTATPLAADHGISRQWCFSFDSAVSQEASTALMSPFSSVVVKTKYLSCKAQIRNTVILKACNWVSLDNANTKSPLYLLNTEGEGGQHFYWLPLLIVLTGISKTRHLLSLKSVAPASLKCYRKSKDPESLFWLFF